MCIPLDHMAFMKYYSNGMGYCNFSFNVWHGNGPCLPVNSHRGLSEYYVTGMRCSVAVDFPPTLKYLLCTLDADLGGVLCAPDPLVCIQCDTNVPTPPEIMLDSRDPKIRLFKLEWCKLAGTCLACSKFRHMQVERLTVQSWSLPRSL